MTPPIVSSQRHSTPFSNKTPSSTVNRDNDYLASKLETELSNRVLQTPFSCFLEHVLAAPNAVINEWSPFLDILERDEDILTLRHKFIEPVSKEVDRYRPFVALANEIKKRADSEFGLRPEAVPHLKFVASFNKTLKGVAETPARRPDVVLIQEDIAEQIQQPKQTQQPSKADLYWKHVVVALEFKVGNSRRKSSNVGSSSNTPFPLSENSRKRKAGATSANSSKKSRTSQGFSITGMSGLQRGYLTQLSGYALEMLSSTNGTRMHALAIFVDGHRLQLWYYDRSGAIRADEWVDVGEDFKTFATVIIAITRLRLVEYGYLSILDWPSRPPTSALPPDLEGASLTLQRVEGSEGETHRLTLTKEIISSRPGIVGRASLVCGATCDTLPGKLVVKISFQLITRKNEVDIISHAKACGVDYLPTCYAWQDFGTLSAGIRGRLMQNVPTEDFKFDDRVLRIIVFKRYIPVYQLNSDLSEFKSVIRDVFNCVVQLHTKAQVLHRDISHTNIMAEETDDHSFRGILNDFDLAIRIDEITSRGCSSLERTGTLPFMAIALLRGPDSPETHLLRHDIESIFYVLVWIAVHYEKDGKFVPSNQLLSWHTGSSAQMYASKVVFVGETRVRLMEPLHDNLKLIDFYEGLRTPWFLRLSFLFRKLYMEYSSCLQEQLAIESVQGNLGVLQSQGEQLREAISDEQLIATVENILKA